MATIIKMCRLDGQAESRDQSCTPLSRRAGRSVGRSWQKWAHLIARLDASPVSRPALNGCQHHQLPAGWICSNEQAHALDLSIRADSEICILPARRQESINFISVGHTLTNRSQSVQALSCSEALMHSSWSACNRLSAVLQTHLLPAQCCRGCA